MSAVEHERPPSVAPESPGLSPPAVDELIPPAPAVPDRIAAAKAEFAALEAKRLADQAELQGVSPTSAADTSALQPSPPSAPRGSSGLYPQRSKPKSSASQRKVLHKGLAVGRLYAGLEMRYDSDGMPYARADFIDQYGGADEWDAAEPERRIDADGSAYTRRQFEEHYNGTKEWDEAPIAARDPEWDRRKERAEERAEDQKKLQEALERRVAVRCDAVEQDEEPPPRRSAPPKPPTVAGPPKVGADAPEPAADQGSTSPPPVVELSPEPPQAVSAARLAELTGFNPSACFGQRGLRGRGRELLGADQISLAAGLTPLMQRKTQVPAHLQAVATAQADSNAPKTLSEWLEQWGGGRNDSQAATRRGGVRRSSVRSKFGSLSSTNSKFSFGRHAPTPRHLGPAAIRREARLAANEVRRARPAGRRPPPPSDYKTGRNGEDLSVLPLITLRGQLADDLEGLDNALALIDPNGVAAKKAMRRRAGLAAKQGLAPLPASTPSGLPPLGQGNAQGALPEILEHDVHGDHDAITQSNMMGEKALAKLSDEQDTAATVDSPGVEAVPESDTAHEPHPESQPLTQPDSEPKQKLEPELDAPDLKPPSSDGTEQSGGE